MTPVHDKAEALQALRDTSRTMLRCNGLQQAVVCHDARFAYAKWSKDYVLPTYWPMRDLCACLHRARGIRGAHGAVC